MMAFASHDKRQDTFSVIAVLAAICMLGFFVRILLSPLEGYGFDVGANQGWAKSAVKLGLAKSYSQQVDGNMLPNYPPLSLMIFASTGHAYQAIVSPEYDAKRIENRVFIKFPSIVADIVTGILLFFIVAAWKGRKAGYLSAAFYALNPAVVYDSAVWGQTDSVYTMFMVACIGAFAMQWNAATGALLALALLTKAQAIVIAPLIGFILLLRGWKAVLAAVAGFVPTFVLVLIPFIPDNGLHGVWNMYAQSIGYYTSVSSNAYNFWWALLSDSANGVTDNQLVLGIMSYRNAGLILFGCAYAWLLWHVWKHRKDMQGSAQGIPHLFYAASIAAYAFFLFNTEMHERYLFPVMALGLPLAFLSRKTAAVYAGVSSLFFFNLLGVLPASPLDRAFYSSFPSLDVFFASFLTFLFFVLLGMRKQLPQRQGILTFGKALKKLTSAAWSRATARSAAPRVP